MKRFERSNGLDTALYKNYLFFYNACIVFIYWSIGKIIVLVKKFSGDR